MALNTPYVKFRRGTPAMYAALATKDADSLYFISEVGAPSGLLYVGDKLISGNVSLNNTLSDLNDILLSADITPNSLLIFDSTKNKWVNKPFSEIFNEIADGQIFEMVGATSDTDGASGTVPQPKAGDDIKFLRGDGKWATINQLTPVVAAGIAQLRTDVNSILGDDAGSSMREVAASEVVKLIANAPANLNNLEKIADKLGEHDNQFVSVINRIETLEQTAIGNLSEELEALRQKDVYLQFEIDDLDARLQWRQIQEQE